MDPRTLQHHFNLLKSVGEKSARGAAPIKTRPVVGATTEGPGGPPRPSSSDRADPLFSSSLLLFESEKASHHARALKALGQLGYWRSATAAFEGLRALAAAAASPAAAAPAPSPVATVPATHQENHGHHGPQKLGEDTFDSPTGAPAGSGGRGSERSAGAVDEQGRREEVNGGVHPMVYHAAMTALAHAGRWRQVERWLLDLEKDLLPQNGGIQAYNCLLHAFAVAGEKDRALALLSRMKEAAPVVKGGSSCEGGRGEDGLIDVVLPLVRDPPRPDARSFTMCIQVCEKAGDLAMVKQLFEEMKTFGKKASKASSNAKPGEQRGGSWSERSKLGVGTVGAVDHAASSSSQHDQASTPHQSAWSSKQAEDEGSASSDHLRHDEDRLDDHKGSDPFSTTSPRPAQEDSSTSSSSAGGASHRSYTSMIASVGRQGDWETATQLLEQMRREGVWPDVRTFTAVLSACRRAGQWTAALDVLDDARGAYWEILYRERTSTPPPSEKGQPGERRTTPSSSSSSSSPGSCGKRDEVDVEPVLVLPSSPAAPVRFVRQLSPLAQEAAARAANTPETEEAKQKRLRRERENAYRRGKELARLRPSDLLGLRTGLAKCFFLAISTCEEAKRYALAENLFAEVVGLKLVSTSPFVRKRLLRENCSGAVVDKSFEAVEQELSYAAGGVARGEKTEAEAAGGGSGAVEQEQDLHQKNGSGSQKIISTMGSFSSGLSPSGRGLPHDFPGSRGPRHHDDENHHLPSHRAMKLHPDAWRSAHVLDLHGLPGPVARAAVRATIRRECRSGLDLIFIVGKGVHAKHREPADAHDHGAPPAGGDDRGGPRSSPAGGGSSQFGCNVGRASTLRSAVEALLRDDLHLTFANVADNDGQILVSSEVLAARRELALRRRRRVMRPGTTVAVPGDKEGTSTAGAARRFGRDHEPGRVLEESISKEHAGSRQEEVVRKKYHC